MGTFEVQRRQDRRLARLLRPQPVHVATARSEREQRRDMEYRRLGPSGLAGQRAVVRIVGVVRRADRRSPRRPTACRPRTRRASTSSTTPSRTRAASRSGSWARRSPSSVGRATRYVISTKVFWGLHDAAQHEEHAEPQVPHAGDRRFARAARPRLRRPAVLPPRRPEHADRRDGVGDVRHRRRAARRSTGARRSGRADEIRAAWDIADSITCTSR